MRYLLFISLLFFFENEFAQFTMEGIVKNEKGENLSFATVFLEGTGFAASTDEKGYYTIKNIPSGSYRLKATFIGYIAHHQDIELSSDIQLDITLQGEIYNLDIIEIQANRASENQPFTKQNLNKYQLQKENTGVDVPFILQWTPSMLVTSDAGTGIGYTGLRLRGSDQTRINVTLNGVPVNDAESHNVFWVDLPDLMGSVNNIQIQRGVGVSTNGAGAFGGMVSINTADIRVNSFADISGTLGAFNTKKLSISAGTGLINDRYLVDARYSLIKSDGYIDRGAADLASYYFSAARVTGKSSLRLNIMSGKELTYQAWYGVPESKVAGDQTALLNHYYTNLGTLYKTQADSVNLFSSGRSYNYYTYPNQVDNYTQTHFQLLHSLIHTSRMKTKTTLFYTKGKGYYEEFRFQDALNNYGIQDFINNSGALISRSDIVRRRWLDNDFAGLMADLDYKISDDLTIQSGLAVLTYVGDHYGNIIKSSEDLPQWEKENKYYKSNGQKSEFTAYLRSNYTVAKKLCFHGDLQIRKLNYEVGGKDNDLRMLQVDYNKVFFNPKFGVNYNLHPDQQVYFSYAVANKEPSRGDFTDNVFNTQPQHEHLQNLELGYKYSMQKVLVESNVYYMKYKNQLVLTGELNDVGAPVRVNVPVSYRLGWENNSTISISNTIALNANTTISLNKIQAFDEIIADYTVDFSKKVIRHENTDISFSPSFTGALQLLYKPSKRFETELSSKFVSVQYLDNTQDGARSLPSYHYQNVRATYHLQAKFVKSSTISVFVNNLLDKKYASNGYSYSYIYGDLVTENYQYPQAGRHVMMTLRISL